MLNMFDQLCTTLWIMLNTYDEEQRNMENRESWNKVNSGRVDVFRKLFSALLQSLTSIPFLLYLARSFVAFVGINSYIFMLYYIKERGLNSTRY